MSITLPSLPYDQTALSPHISEETLSYHYGKHHQSYVTNLNKLIEGTALDAASLEDIIRKSHKNPALQGVFNNAAQVWNHTFYWQSLSPQGGGMPAKDFLAHIEKDFGDFDAFKKKFVEAALTQFGSGWAWLVLDGQTLKILKTSNADTPLLHDGVTPLLTCDVWEHAYYLDYQNRRPDYVNMFFDHLAHWDFADKLRTTALSHLSK